MRKLTGYIGAMIIVFALAGSILAGYALNINGTSAIINEYEKITDISGLYEHSDEKSYIEYNPASNYTNYSGMEIYKNNLTGGHYYKKVTNNSIVIKNNVNKVLIDNIDQGAVNNNPYCAFICSKFYIYYSAGGSGAPYLLGKLGSNGGDIIFSTDDISITVNGTNVNLTFNGTTYYYSDVALSLVYATNNYDYFGFSSNSLNRYVYMNNTNQIISAYESGTPGIATGTSFYYAQYQYSVNDSSLISEYAQIDGGVYSGKVGFVNGTNNPWGVFYPISVNSNLKNFGIDYTESSRVNNYPMERTDLNVTTQTGTLILNQVGDNNYFYYNSQGNKQMNNAYSLYNSSRGLDGMFITPIEYPTLNIGTPGCLPESTISFNYNRLIWNYDGFHNVKLSNVLTSYNIPSGTTTVKITTNSNSSYNFNNGSVNVTLDKNLVYFSYLPNLIKDNGYVPGLNSEIAKKDYLIYDVTNNICTVYTYNGIARYSGSPDDIGVFYYEDDGTNKAFYSYQASRDTTQHQGFLTDITNRPTPFITIETTQSTPGTIKYADITKGFAIKDNADNVIWNNNYENGEIKILFRAENTNDTYSNTFNISGSRIKVDYINGKYNISVNYREPVNVGAWRNIILDFNLVNGTLHVIPVKTFNSFTNVVTDNSKTLIRGLYETTPTNTIRWENTNNSLLFNVYTTYVFMNTFNVVMVNPSLDINNYFTDLNQFYRLNMSNFSIYGNSMTINGERLIVNDGKITYGDKTVELKNINVTYADGKVTIGDNHGFIELGEITTTNISMDGNWYFITDLERGYTTQKTIYDWDWGTFIFDNTQFCVFYIGIVAAALIVARKYCNLSIIDYMVLVASIVIALGVQVIA